MITLILAQDYIPYPSETQYLGFIRANYLELFPRLLDQSQFNRRARSLGWLVEQFRRYRIIRKGWYLHTQFLLDTKPVPAMGYKRGKQHSDFFGDKGFLGWKWQTQIFDQTNNLIWKPHRANQRYQNAPGLDRWLNSIRECIEGLFHEVQNTGRNIERLLAKTVLGL